MNSRGEDSQRDAISGRLARVAIVAPAMATLNECAEMWDGFADQALQRGDVAEERELRATAQRSRERAARLYGLAS